MTDQTNAGAQINATMQMRGAFRLMDMAPNSECRAYWQAYAIGFASLPSQAHIMGENAITQSHSPSTPSARNAPATQET